MSKITYEEAKIAMRNMCNLDGYMSQMLFHDGNMGIIFEYIEQQQPPTWDEVVKAWEELGYELHEHCIYFVGQINCRFENKGTLIYLGPEGVEVVLEEKNGKLPNAELKALALTIRYQEAKPRKV